MFSLSGKTVQVKQHKHHPVSAHTPKGKDFFPGEEVFVHLPNAYERYKWSNMSSSQPAWCAVTPLQLKDIFYLYELLDQPRIDSCGDGWHSFTCLMWTNAFPTSTSV